MTTRSRDDVTVERRHLLLLTLSWVAAILVVNPTGDFPILDDWSYGQAVRTLVTERVWRLTDWTSVPVGPQVLWGALFSLPAGFSFGALRSSILVLSWVGAIGVYRLLRACDSHTSTALLGAATILFCPVVFALSYTFMTDVPTLALTVWAGLFSLRHAERARTSTVAATVLLCVAATLVRQVGLAIAIGGAAAILAGSGGKRRYIDALMVVATPALALLAYNAYLAHSGAPFLYRSHDGDLAGLLAAGPLVVARTALARALHVYIYVGLFLLPAAALIRWPFRRPAALAWLVVAGAAPGAIMAWRHPLPFLPNVLQNTGLNPVTVVGADHWLRTPDAVWITLTVAAGVSAAMISGVLLAGATTWRAQRPSSGVALCAVGIAAYLSPLLALPALFDRYLMVPAALVLVLLSLSGAFRESPPRWRLAAATALLAVVMAFDTTALHDFMAFNRARWDAVNALLAEGMAPETIEAGFEANRWLTYRAPLSYAEVATWWTPRPSATAVISLAGAEGWSPSATYPFSRWLGAGPGQVYVLRQSPKD